jgi:hypothetical protein
MGLFSKSKPVVAEGIKFFLNKDFKIDIQCGWPTIESREEMERYAREYAFMIANVCNRAVMPYVQTTIATHGVKTNSEKMSNLILIHINGMLNPEANNSANDNSPIVAPENAFQVRGEG